MKRAFVYVRTSTDQQELSPEVQRAQLAAYCAAKGYEVRPTPDEIGVSGSVAFAERPVGGAMLARLGEVEAFVFSKLDRAFRDVVDCLLTVERLRGAGVAVHFLDLGVDTTTPAGELCLTMMAGFARFERRRIAERIKEALAAAKRQGKKIGPAPFGSRNLARVVDGKKVDGGRHARLEAEAAVVERIVELDSNGLSLRAIAGVLNSDGVRTRKGKTWGPQQVSNVIGRAVV